MRAASVHLEPIPLCTGHTMTLQSTSRLQHDTTVLCQCCTLLCVRTCTSKWKQATQGNETGMVRAWAYGRGANAPAWLIQCKLYVHIATHLLYVRTNSPF